MEIAEKIPVPLEAEVAHENGRWTVQLVRNLGATEGLKSFNAEGRYSFGIALHGADNPGRKHWVSLPLTLGFDADDTDFAVK